MDLNTINPFLESFEAIMPQLGFGNIRRGDLSISEQQLKFTGVMILVGIVGALKGNVVYCLETENAKTIASTMMMGMPVDELDEMSQSALSELANMLTATAATGFSEIGLPIDISTPTLLHGENVSVKLGAKQAVCVRLFADDMPVDINIAIEA